MNSIFIHNKTGSKLLYIREYSVIGIFHLLDENLRIIEDDLITRKVNGKPAYKKRICKLENIKPFNQKPIQTQKTLF